jgi:cyclopropane fatty-acyl-phospholipid synthase-like methyltransferase
MGDQKNPNDKRVADAQRAHWQATYTQHPQMYGTEPSEPARHAAEAFRAAGASTVVELGAGHGRDALFFARKGFSVHATDFRLQCHRPGTTHGSRPGIRPRRRNGMAAHSGV